jgi:chitinase
MGKAIYYHTNWATYGRDFQIHDLADDINEVAYAFCNIQPDGTVILGDPYADIEKRFTSEGVQPLDQWSGPEDSFYGNFNQIRKLQLTRDLKVSLSIGGWTWSRNFSAMVRPENIHRALQSIASIVTKYPIFSGVNIDWEYVSDDGINYGNSGNLTSPQDAANCLEFLKRLKRLLPEYRISFACVADPNKVKFNIRDYNDVVDEFHIMTYDFADGNWGDMIATHHTNLYPSKTSKTKFSVHETVDYYLSQGATSTKLFIGGAFYSRGFSNTNGLGQSANGGSPDKSWEAGICDYKDLPRPGAIEMWDNESKASYSYDAVRKVFNSYDTSLSLKYKCQYINQRNLGGIIIWETSGDDSKATLTKTIKHNLVEPSVPVPVEPSVPVPVEPKQGESFDIEVKNFTVKFIIDGKIYSASGAAMIQLERQ